MSDPALRQLASEAKRARRLRAGTCIVCGTDQQLTPARDGVRCYEHRMSASGAVELHHLAGKANIPGLLVPLTGNAHREFHDRERVLGLDRLPAANAEPLLVLAQILKGVGLLLLAFAEWLAGYVAARAAGLAPVPFPVAS